MPVNLLVDTSAVLSLHTQLYRALQQLGVQDVEPMWTLEGFTPHVTRQSSGRFETGRSHIARRLYIVEALAAEELQQKKIVNKLFLGRTTA